MFVEIVLSPFNGDNKDVNGNLRRLQATLGRPRAIKTELHPPLNYGSNNSSSTPNCDNLKCRTTSVR